MDVAKAARVSRMAAPMTCALALTQRLGKGEYGEVIRGALDGPADTAKARAYKFMRSDDFDHDVPPVLRELYMCAEMGARHSVFAHGSRHVVLGSDVGDCDLSTIFYDIQCAVNDVKRHFATELCERVAAAHSRGIVHRDVKPHNLIVRFGTDDTSRARALPRVDLIDFGLSVRTAEPTDTNVVTIWWRAPEIMLGLPYSKACDAWAVGIVVAQMLSCEVPQARDEADFLRELWAWSGHPSETEWPAMFASHELDELGLRDVPSRSGRTARIALEPHHEEFRPLLEGLLQQVPEERWTLDRALAFLHSVPLTRSEDFETNILSIRGYAARAASNAAAAPQKLPSRTPVLCLVDDDLPCSWRAWEPFALRTATVEDFRAVHEAASCLALPTDAAYVGAEFDAFATLDLFLLRGGEDFIAAGTVSREALIVASVIIVAAVTSDSLGNADDLVPPSPKSTFASRCDAVRKTVMRVACATGCRFMPLDVRARVMGSKEFAAVLTMGKSDIGRHLLHLSIDSDDDDVATFTTTPPQSGASAIRILPLLKRARCW